MIIGAFLRLVAGLLSSLYNALPAWHMFLGTGIADGSSANGGGIDNNVIFYGLQYVFQFDKILPIHDAAAVQLLAVVQINTALYAYRFTLLILNLVRGSGAK